MNNDVIISPIKLTIGILVSNRIQYIRSVMEGIKPLLENIPSELIAIDTKGAFGDGSIEVVKHYTEKIYPFVWCDDFSAARNTIFEYAKGEWFLALDDDEVMDDVQDLIDFFVGENCSQFESGSFILRNYDAEGKFTVSNVVRLFRRRKSTKYVGAIHEYINDTRQPTKAFSTVIHHYGYAFKSLEEAQKHQERNVTILNRELQESGYTPHLCAQMTQELIYLESSTEKGLEFAKNAIEMLKEKNQLEDPASQYIMYATVLYYLRNEDIKRAKEQIVFLKSSYPLLETTQLVFSGVSSELALAQRDVREMLQNALQYISWWDWKQENEEKVARQQIFCFPQYYTVEYYHHMLHIAAAAANELECFRKAQSIWKRFSWQAEGVKASLYQQDLRDTLLGCKRVQALQERYDEVLQRLELLEQAESELNILKKEELSLFVKEYEMVMKQLQETLFVILQPLLRVDSEGLLLLRMIIADEADCKITQLKDVICEECEAFLNRNR